MEPWCMYFAGEYVQYHRRVRKDTGAQANYFVGIVKEDSGDVLVKAYLSQYAKTPIMEFTSRISLCDPEPNSKRKLRKGDMFRIDGGDPNFHGFQMKIDAKDGKHLVTVNVPFLYGEGSLPDEFFGYCRNLLKSFGGSVDTLSVIGPLYDMDISVIGSIHLGKHFEVVLKKQKVNASSLEFYKKYRPWLDNGILDICAYPLEYAGEGAEYNKLYYLAGDGGSLITRVFVEPVNNQQAIQRFVLDAAAELWRALPAGVEYGSLKLNKDGSGEMYPFDPVSKTTSGPFAISPEVLSGFRARMDGCGLWSGWAATLSVRDLWIQRMPRMSEFVGLRELRHIPGHKGEYGDLIRLEGRKGH